MVLVLKNRRHKRHGLDSWVRNIPWRRKWQPTPVFLLWESHGQRILASYSLGGPKSQTQLKQCNVYTSCTHIYPLFSDTFPISVIIECWVEFLVLYSRSLLVTCLINSSVYNSSTLATACKELTHWKRLWCWEGLGARGEGDDRGWDGWMASLTLWTWVSVNSRSWWWTGRPGVLLFMGSQRVRHDWATDLIWSDLMTWNCWL